MSDSAVIERLGFQPIYNWKPDRPDPRDEKAPTAVISTMPAEYSLRQEMPSVYNQLQLGSCAPNATCAVLQFKQMLEGIVTGSLGDCPARLMLYYLDRVREGSINYDAGSFVRDNFASLRKTGVCPESVWPYEISKFTEKPDPVAYERAPWGRIKHYNHPVEESSIMYSILEKRPVVFGFTVPACFEGEQCMNTGIMPMPERNERKLGGHAVVKIGWKPGYWECRNSWGPDVMDEGYFWMPKEFADEGWCSDFRAITE